MVLPEVLSAYGNCVHERLADLAVLVGLGESGEAPSSLAQKFIKAIIDLRTEMELPLKPNGLQASDIPSVVEEALAEAGDLYPVPRYMTEIEVTAIVRDLLPTT